MVGRSKSAPEPSDKSFGYPGVRLHALCNPYLPFLLVIVLLLGLISVMPMRINHDASFCLYTGRLLTEGKVLYVDWWDNNPPLIFYLYAIPALISKLSHINMIFIFSLSVVSLVLWSSFSIRRQLINSRLQISPSDIGILLFFWAMFSLYVYQENDFGQKDHLFVLFFVPFYVYRWIRCEGGDPRIFTAIVTGFLGAVGTCIKPTFVVMPALCEVYLLLRYRSLKNLLQPEIVVFVVTCICYAAHFFLLPETARTNLVERMPYLLFEAYPKLMVPVSRLEIINRNILFFMICCALFPYLFTIGRGSDLWNMARSMSVMVVAGITIYLIHFKGFSYHLLSALGPTSLIIGILIAESKFPGFRDSAFDENKFTFLMTSRQACWLMVFLMALIVSAVAYRISTKSPTRFADTPFSRVLVQYSKEHDYVLVLSTERGIIWPTLLQSERRQASRHGMVEELPLFYYGITEGPDGKFPYHTRGNAPKEESRLLRELKEDIEKFRPKLIVIHNPTNGLVGPKGFRMQDYLSEMGFINDAMKDYDQTPKLGDFVIYLPKKG